VNKFNDFKWLSLAFVLYFDYRAFTTGSTLSRVGWGFMTLFLILVFIKQAHDKKKKKLT
jgi:hypothetical protein